MAGVTAKLLHVDLTTRQARTEEIPEVVLRKHLGGGALAAYILLRDMPAGVDPLGPDNVLVFMTSVINGLSLSGSNRYTAAAKSPLTGAFGESEAGRIDPEQFFAARNTYYEMAGWDPKTGAPTATKLVELGVEAAR